jgi:hypothetical protein
LADGPDEGRAYQVVAWYLAFELRRETERELRESWPFVFYQMLATLADVWEDGGRGRYPFREWVCALFESVGAKGPSVDCIRRFLSMAE